MRKYLILFLVVFTTLPIVAQNVSNVRVSQNGKDIVITYELDKEADVSLSYIAKGMSTPKKLYSVYGDVGVNISSGSKVIVWKVLEECERFIHTDVEFFVTAKKSTKQESRDLKNSKIYPWGGMDIFGGYVNADECSYWGLGMTAYFSWNYYKPHRWGMVADIYTHGAFESFAFNIGAFCMLTPKVCIFAAPGVGWNYKSGKYELITYFPTPQWKEIEPGGFKTCFSFHVGAGISFDWFITTLHLSYPYFAGVGVGFTI